MSQASQGRRKFSAEFKTETVLEAIKGEKSIAQICRDRNIKDTLYYKWRDQFEQGVGTIVPLYRILAGLHLLDTIAGLTLVLSSTLAPFTVWVLVSFIKQVPYEIEEAARIDGASLAQIMWRVLLPVSMPGLVTMGLINFINAWNNLLYPLSFSTSKAAKTLSVSITEVFAGYSPWGKPWELIMAVGVVMVAPVVVLVLLSQRSIVSGLTRGAIK